MKATLAAVFFWAIALSAYCQNKIEFYSNDTARINISVRKDSAIFVLTKRGQPGTDTVKFNIQKTDSVINIPDSNTLVQLLQVYINSDAVDSILKRIRSPKFARLEILVNKIPSKKFEVDNTTHITVDTASHYLIISNEKHSDTIAVSGITILDPPIENGWPDEIVYASFLTIVIFLICLVVILIKWNKTKRKLRNRQKDYTAIKEKLEVREQAQLVASFPELLIKHFKLTNKENDPKAYAKTLIEKITKEENELKSRVNQFEIDKKDLEKLSSQKIEQLTNEKSKNGQLTERIRQLEQELMEEREKLSQEIIKYEHLKSDFENQQKTIKENAERIIAKYYRPMEVALDNKSDYDEVKLKPMLLSSITEAAFHSFSYCSIIADRFTDYDDINTQLLIGKSPQPNGIVDKHSTKSSTDPLAFLVREILLENKVEEFSSVFVRGLKIEL